MGKLKHGMHASSEYGTWRAMRYRCSRPTAKNWHNYGGRGISVCKRWLKFENFYADMGPRPEGACLDRINNNGNYSPKNCRWTTPKINARNKRTSRLVKIAGVTQTIAAWAEQSGVSHGCIWARLDVGLSGIDLLKPSERASSR